jgi:hypothetical protein
VVVVRSRLFDPKKRDLQTALRSIIYVIEQAAAAMAPGVTQSLVLYDREGAGTSVVCCTCACERSASARLLAALDRFCFGAAVACAAALIIVCLGVCLQATRARTQTLSSSRHWRRFAQKVEPPSITRMLSVSFADSLIRS